MSNPASIPALLPRTGTIALREFSLSATQIHRFLHFLLRVVGSVDQAADIAHNALVNTERDEATKAKMIAEWKERATAVSALSKNRQFLIEVILVRHVENYLNYLAALLNEIFIARPETLRSGEKIDVQFVLEHDSFETLVRALAERKVDSLAYSSFGDLSLFFEDRFKLQLVTDSEKSAIIEAIETRNISVHNRCLVNRKYQQKTGCSKELIGKLKDLYIGDIDALVPILFRSAVDIDKAARQKLGLQGVRFKRAK